MNYSIIPDIDVFSSKNAEIEMLNEMPVITVNLNSVSTLNKYIKRIGEIFNTRVPLFKSLQDVNFDNDISLIENIRFLSGEVETVCGVFAKLPLFRQVRYRAS